MKRIRVAARTHTGKYNVSQAFRDTEEANKAWASCGAAKGEFRHTPHIGLKMRKDGSHDEVLHPDSKGTVPNKTLRRGRCCGECLPGGEVLEEGGLTKEEGAEYAVYLIHLK